MNKYIFLPLLALAMLMTGCKSEPDYGSAIFITGPLQSQSMTFPIDGQSEMSLTVTSTDVALADTKVSVAVAPELIDEFNRTTRRSCQVPPSESYQIEGADAVIKAGRAQSTQIKLKANASSLQDGVSYCLPITIKQPSGSMQILETSRTAYIMFKKVIHTKVAVLNGSSAFDIKPFWDEATSPVKALNQLTLEMKVCPTGLSDGKGISSIFGCEENFLFRFGDGASIAGNQLSLAKASIGQPAHPNSKNHYDMKFDRTFENNEWFHLACTYDGIYLRIYINGTLANSIETKGGTINLSTAYDGYEWNKDGFAIGRSAGYSRFFKGYISECRVWSVPRTMSQIQDGMDYVDPKSEGLLAYWRFNGETQPDGTIRDETGHGYDATPYGKISYIDN